MRPDQTKGRNIHNNQLSDIPMAVVFISDLIRLAVVKPRGRAVFLETRKIYKVSQGYSTFVFQENNL